MPRPSAGPRQLDSSGVWYACKVVNGKRHAVSLQTKNRSEAMRRWPAAQAALEASLRPQRVPWDRLVTIGVPGPSGELVEASEQALALFNEKELDCEVLDESTITWAEAEEIAAKRYKRRRGKEPSRSWHYQIRYGLKHLSAKAPLHVSVSDVRQMVETMEEAGLAATTIQQRTSALSGVIESLIKTGRTDDTFINPFSRVDTAAVGTNHFYKAKPEDYRAMAQWDNPMMQVLIFSGARISEAFNGEYRNGCLIIKEGKNRASIRDVPLPEHLMGDVNREMTLDTFRIHFNKRRPHHHLTPHSFRHGWKTAAREAGIDHVLAERLLGHAIPKMDRVYGEFSQEVLRKAAEPVWQVIQQWMK